MMLLISLSPSEVGVAPSTPFKKHEVTDLDSKPPPSMKALREAIPEHCFKPNLYLSIGYIIRDLIALAMLAYGATHIPLVESPALRWLLWSVYGFAQGLIFTGLWILAHECGHGALFSQSILNNCLGFVLHSLLMVPFYSWKYSHARHHRYTNHMEKDTAFVPARKGHTGAQKVVESFFDLAEDTPALSLVVLLGHQLIGWPMYIFFEMTAGVKSSPKPESEKCLTRSHLDPLAGIFTADQAPFILISDLGLIATATSLYFLGRQLGSSTTAFLYILPYLWVNHWIVAITYLHHTHPDIAHYESDAWTFQRGALATVDREFGWIGRHLFHGIVEFHVIHHLFTRIPFYHAEEATNSIQPLLGKYYKRQSTSFWFALWQTFVQCKHVVPSTEDAGILHWPNVVSQLVDQ